jgi:hypothetical protein
VKCSITVQIGERIGWAEVWIPKDFMSATNPEQFAIRCLHPAFVTALRHAENKDKESAGGPTRPPNT